MTPAITSKVLFALTRKGIKNPNKPTKEPKNKTRKMTTRILPSSPIIQLCLKEEMILSILSNLIIHFFINTIFDKYEENFHRSNHVWNLVRISSYVINNKICLIFIIMTKISPFELVFSS